VALEQLEAADVLREGERFDKVFAMNVNLFWVRSPGRELDLIRRLLRPGGALYLFYGYDGASPPAGAARVPQALTGHLTEAGFAVELRTAGSLVGVVATPQQ
jgi:SAM-dependent methyltransferase